MGPVPTTYYWLRFVTVIVVASAPMRFAKALAAGVWMVLVLPSTGWAQDDGAAPAEDAAAAETEAQPNTDDQELSASGYATTEQPFEARRGLFVDGEFGVFMTIGGRNSNNLEGGFPTRSISNANPYVAMILGYDVYADPGFAFNAGLKLGASFNGGSARLSQADIDATQATGASTFANDYSAYQAGVNLSFIFMVLERLSITVKANGGVTFVDANPNVDFCGANASNPGPSPTLPNQPTDEQRNNFRAACGDTDAGNLALGGVFGGSAGVEWYTLLEGFSVGVQVGFQGLLVDGEFIPGIAIPATLRYTF